MEEGLELAHTISLFYKATFPEHIHNSQHKCMEAWFQQLAEVANVGTDVNVQLHDVVLCKLVGDYFAPVTYILEPWYR